MSVAGRQRAGRRPSRAAGAQTRAALGAAPVRAPATQAAAPAFALPQLQRKLAVGRSDSPFESEADQVADSVLTGKPAPAVTPLPTTGLGPAAQRSATEAEEDEVQASEIEAAEEEPLQAQTTEEVEEEDPVQAEMEDEEPVMAQAEEEEEEPIQMQMQMEDEEQEPVQAKSTGSRARDRGAVEQAIRAPGSGRALPGDVRNRIETSIGADLSDVRVHDDADAARAARGIGARAFAHGRDIWLGPGESARDTRLIAHEAAHVVQQTGSHTSPGRGTAPASPVGAASTHTESAGAVAAQALVQRQGSGGGSGTEASAPVEPPVVSTPGGHRADFTGGLKKLQIHRVSLPDKPGKASVNGPFTAQKPGSRNDDPRREWLNGITISTSEAAKVLTEAKGFRTTENASVDQLIFILKVKNQDTYVVGTHSDIVAQTKIPNWRKNGNNDYMQVDHIKEHQLGGDNDLENYQLLDSRTNLSAGRVLRDEIKKRIDTAKGQLKNRAIAENRLSPQQLAELDKGADTIRQDFDEVSFTDKTTRYLRVNGDGAFWEKSDIEDAKHLSSLDLRDASSLTQAEQEQFLGSENKLMIYLGRGASARRDVNWGGTDGLADGAQDRWIGEHFDLVDIGPHGNAPTKLVGRVYARHERFTERLITVPLERLGGLNYAFRMPPNLRYSDMLEFSGWSLVSVDSFEIEQTGLVLRGSLNPSANIFKGDTSIDLVVRDGDVTLSKTFSGGEFDVPGPVQVTGCSLTVLAGTGGGGLRAQIDGELHFEVERVGKGVLRGSAASDTGFAVEGEFDFDPDLFRGADARIRVGYADDTFTGQGTLKIGDGQIRGIRSAELNVTVENESWEATGTVVPKIPGVTQGTLSMSFDPEGGFEIAGELTLGAGIPRLKSGKLNAKLAKQEDVWKVAASGEAQLDIPGVDTRLVASYDDGKFRAEATVAYARGIASGRATVGATNMPVDPETGSFTEGEPTETVTIYGAGEVTIRFTPWLQGTARLKLLPDGSMEVTGRVALPDTLEVFPEKKLERQLISIGVDIPVFGVAVAGQRIGIFLNINGALTAKASIGPGELRNVAVEVTYNPEDENTTRVSGSARFVVPAEAGLRLAIQGAIGAGIPVVSARAGLEIGGELGISGEATAGAEVEWTPSNGLSMEADVGVSAAPKFTFDIAGFVDVSADLLLTKIELYSKRWQLASFEYGSGMQVGASLTVRIENNELQPISMDDVDLTVPDIDPVGLARGLIGKVV